MTVYVDNMRARFGRMVMCHMIADTLDELHAMADRIGIARRHFQDTHSGPHYDISLSRRALAIQYGARDITLRQCAVMCMYRRRHGQLCKPDETAEFLNRLRESGVRHG